MLGISLLTMQGLTVRRMLETAVGGGADQLRFEQEITEGRGVDADIAAVLGRGVVAGLRSCLGSISISGTLLGRGGIVELVVRVVDEILFGRHLEGLGEKGGRGLKKGERAVCKRWRVLEQANERKICREHRA